ncbi:uncharacterized protein LOC111693857 [Trichogramma pretiosum]|uniref:uncharacterized protein LOC111693857 n=1 Tax=Trichogramma pretiosum TaxID=7493 RepID=UPI000C718BC0|nr:uncharacterized protein LOC111693857 [Trichogramma pretiosum]
MPRYFGYVESKDSKVPRTTRYNENNNHIQRNEMMNIHENSTDDTDVEMQNESSMHQSANISSEVSIGSSYLFCSRYDNEVHNSNDTQNTYPLFNTELRSVYAEEKIDFSSLNSTHFYGLEEFGDDNFQDKWMQDICHEFYSDGESDSEEEDSFFDCSSVFDRPASEDDSISHLEKLLKNDDMDDTIKADVVSKSEILAAVLQYSLTYNLAQSAIADLLKMLNCFLGNISLPDTRYLINKLFNDTSIMNYHGVCPTCEKYLGLFQWSDKFIYCDTCEVKINFKESTYNSYFVILNVDKEIVNLIQENKNYYLNIVKLRQEKQIGVNEISDFYDGVMYEKLTETLSSQDEEFSNFDYVTTVMNSDGSPIFESSNYSIWPIQFIINELPYDVRTAHPFVCGLWFGKGKPNMNIFLKPFVDYMNRLANDGVSCIIDNVERQIKIYTQCCCVDSAARPQMQGFIQYNGYFGCGWCLHPGVYVASKKKGCVKYPWLEEEIPGRNMLQTVDWMEQSLYSKKPIFGVKRPSCLINMKHLDIINGFVPDSMHCLNLGIAAQFFNYWFKEKNKPYSLTHEEIEKIDEVLIKIKVPNQIRRLSRSINDLTKWKSREWENWLLYYSLPILLMFPRLREYAQHWMLLVHASYLLLQKNITYSEIETAENLLIDFVQNIENIYPKAAMTYNVHQLLHLVSSVANWGPLWAHSGYTFENGNEQLVKKIQAAKGVIPQICRALSMAQSNLVLKKHIFSKPYSRVSDYITHLQKKTSKLTYKFLNARYFGRNYKVATKWIQELNISNESRIYRKMVKDRCLFNSSKINRQRSDNSYAITHDGTFIQILDFIVDPINRLEFTLVRMINIENIYPDREASIKKITEISENIFAIKTADIAKVCVFISIDKNISYVGPVPNLYYY